ncbi:MAG: DMT family transporter [Gammaproteobacteria bacterium]
MKTALTAPASTSHDANDRLGLLLAALSAAGLGLAVALARFAYQGGANGLTVATMRAALAALGLLVFCRLTRRHLRLPFSTWLHCLGLGALMAMTNYGNVGAVEFIPIGLAALLFFTFPPITALIHIAVLRERLSLAKLLAVTLAFIGIALMLGVSLGASDWRGIALSLTAAVAAAWNPVWLARKVRHIDMLVLTFHMAAVAACILITASVLSGRFQPPHSAIGWFGLSSVIILQTSSLPVYYLAVARLGALKSAMVTNVQPVVSIAAAFLLYGEVLTPVQFLGGGLVLAGIWLMQHHDRHRQRP